jgi:hypothetical protein
MIAPAKPQSEYDHAAVNQQFEQMLTRIRLMALHAFRDKDHELRYELTAEVVARAYAAFVRLARQGRAELGYATPLALFSIKQVKSGRRMGAKLNIKDVSSEYAQMNKGFSMLRLDRYNKRKELWKEVVVEDQKSGPAEIAAMRIDFEAWLNTLDLRERRIAKVLATGETTGATARKFGVSPSRISQLRRQFMEAWQAFLGELPSPAAA